MNESTFQNEIILYQPDSTLSLDVRLEKETVWLTQSQMTELFQRDRSVITRHISNIFKEQELEEESNVHFLHIPNSDKPVKLYSLDVIISVGYRVKSKRGTQFRQWANRVLKEYLIRGYSLNQRFFDMERKMDHRFQEHYSQIRELSGKVDFILKTTLPPREGLLFNGQIFDAYLFVCDLIKRAKNRIVLIDNYIDESVLTLLDKRSPGVSATIFTQKRDKKLILDLERHNDQYMPINLRYTSQVHDRFLVIDDTMYHIGASIKDLGKKLFAFSRMEMSPTLLLDRL